MNWQVVVRRASYRDEQSEDRLLTIPRPPDGLLICVADGVGGRDGSREAAARAVGLAAQHQAGVASSDATAWSRLIAWIDGEIAADQDAGETTLILAEVTGAAIVGASVGDSAAWFVTPEAVVDLTQYQQRKPFVGSGRAAPMSFAFTPTGGGTLLLATDGLFGQAREEAIVCAARLPDLEQVADALVAAARGQMTGQFYDDLALVVLRFQP